jgi:hypothetical protein
MHEIWPNFFLVGAAKAGTTSLYEYLSRCPEIFFPRIKEPHFFTGVRPANERKFYIDAVTKREKYLRLFRKAGKYAVVGDASPSYLWHPEAPKRIHDVAPDARIAIILRDPVERAYSHYLMDYREGVQSLPFYEALLEDMNLPEKGWGVSWLYFELGLYARQIERYLAVFKPEQIKILLFDEFARDVRGTLKEILRFLRLDPSAADRIDVSRRYNSYSAPRSPIARRLAGSKVSRFLGQTIVPREVGEFIFYRFLVREAVKPPMDPRARDLLSSLYENEVIATERLLGRSLPQLRRSWGGGVRSSADQAGA